MVEQVIKYSDGSETSIKYRGVIVDGVLQSEQVTDNETTMDEEKEVEAPQEVEEAVEAPVEEEVKEEVEAD